MKKIIGQNSTLMIKTLSMLGIENFLNLRKGVYKSPTANTMLNGARLKAFPCKTKNKAWMSALISFNIKFFS